MKIEQIVTECLAEMAYYVSDNGEAAVIDPLREISAYIRMAKADNAKIKYVFLTHFHADFVSGHVDLARKTGATIIFGPGAVADYNFHEAVDDELFPLGDINIRVLHTPGHTMESISLLLEDKDKNTPYIFTGDALFIDDVGRPDLAVKSGSITQEDLASHLYDSLRNKIMVLPDDIIIYPNHGAGSSCGKNMSIETFDTLKNQKKSNYALRADITRDEFIKEVTTGLKPPPPYFPYNVKLNKRINKDIDTIIYRGITPIGADNFQRKILEEDVLVIDARTRESIRETGIIPSSWFVGIDGNFAPTVGTIIKNMNQQILFLTENGREEEIVKRFARVGFDNVQGYLFGGITNWKNHGFETVDINSISAIEFAEILKNNQDDVVVMDVRRESEFLSQRVLDVQNYPLDTIHENIYKLDKDKHYVLHCQTGYRSLIAATILRTYGIDKLTNVRGGFEDIQQIDIVLSPYVCPSTLL